MTSVDPLMKSAYNNDDDCFIVISIIVVFSEETDFCIN